MGLLIVVCALGPMPGLAAAPPPTFEQVRAQWQSSEATVLDRDGRTLSTVRIDPDVRRLDWVPLSSVSPVFLRLLRLAEDRRFDDHDGVDWRAVAAALAEAARAGLDGDAVRPRGASTLSMQLAGLLASGDSPPPRRRALPDKISQAIAAIRLERTWTKAQILEAFVNLVPFRGEQVGIDALARLMFGKDPSALDARESALAVALIRAPNAAPARIAERACRLHRNAFAAAAPDEVDCTGWEGFARIMLARTVPASAAGESLAPHLAHRMLTRPGERMVTSIDAGVQRLARDLLRRHLRELASREVEDGAVVVLDNTTGEVRAWVGSSGPLSSAPAVDAVLARRQAGSTLKPFLYARAIGDRRLTAASIVDDSPFSVDGGGGLYTPQNYDRDFKGAVSVRTALGSSLNVPAVRTLRLVGADSFADTLRALGITSVVERGEHYGPSLALGSVDVTLIELANAYRTLANGGRRSPIRFTRAADAAADDGSQVLEPAAAFIVTDILADANARALTFGWHSVLANRYRAAVKTGTSKDMRDNWCIGFTSRFTVAVWVGNASGAPMHDVSGATGAAPIWAELIAALEAGATRPPPRDEAGAIRIPIRYADAIEPSRDEWFLPGTQVATVQRAPVPDRPRIVTPLDGTVIALDPDVPPQAQRLRLAATGVGTRWRWFAGDVELGSGSPLDWPPQPGHHVIRLVDDGGSTVRTVQVEVRGANRVKTR